MVWEDGGGQPRLLPDYSSPDSMFSSDPLPMTCEHLRGCLWFLAVMTVAQCGDALGGRGPSPVRDRHCQSPCGRVASKMTRTVMFLLGPGGPEAEPKKRRNP